MLRTCVTFLFRVFLLMILGALVALIGGALIAYFLLPEETTSESYWLTMGATGLVLLGAGVALRLSPAIPWKKWRKKMPEEFLMGIWAVAAVTLSFAVNQDMPHLGFLYDFAGKDGHTIFYAVMFFAFPLLLLNSIRVAREARVERNFSNQR